MKRCASLLAVLLLAAGGAMAAPAGREGPSQLAFFFEPILQKGFGGVAYDLSYDAGGGWTDLSRLEFPELSLEAGGLVGMTINRDGRRQWLIELGATHSTAEISGTMNDYDWFKPTGFPKVPWSYTYSDDSTVSWQAFADAAWTFASGESWLVAVYGMYRYQDMSHVEDTITGWQYDWSTYPNPVGINPGFYDPTTDVLEYSLTSHTIGLGLLGELSLLPGFTLQLRACYTPVYVSDRDDHKVRTKLSTASGWGNGLFTELKATYQFAPISSIRPYLSLDGNFIYYVVDTTQRQYWYGNADVPFSGTAQGTVLTGVGHVITSTQFTVGLRVGFLM